MIHLPRYWSMGASVLARDLGVSKSTISHLLRGKSHPLYSTASRVVKCLDRELGFPLGHDEVFSEDGSYPTPYVCMLVGCKGCLPEAFLPSGRRLKPDSRRILRGECSGDNIEFENLSELEG